MRLNCRERSERCETDEGFTWLFEQRVHRKDIHWAGVGVGRAEYAESVVCGPDRIRREHREREDQVRDEDEGELVLTCAETNNGQTMSDVKIVGVTVQGMKVEHFFCLDSQNKFEEVDGPLADSW